MLRSSLLIALAWASFNVTAMGAAWHVDRACQNEAGDGRSWETAFPTIQQAINIARSGDVIQVATGIYRESLVLKTGISVEGGYETGQGEPNAETILDGSDRATVVGSTVLIAQAEDVTLRGFFIRGGRAMEEPRQGHGGGVLVRASARVRIVDCVLYANMARHGGGMAWLDSSSGTVSQCFLSGNKGYEGGGVFVLDSVLAMERCVLSGNSAMAGGGAVFRNASVELVNSVLSGNTALMNAGGLWADSSEVTLRSCTVRANGAGAESTGAIHAVTGALVLRNTAIEGNHGFGVYAPDPQVSLVMERCAVNGNTRDAVGPDFTIPAQPLVSEVSPDKPWFVSGAGGVWSGYAEYDPVSCATVFPVAESAFLESSLVGRLIDVNTRYRVHAVILKNTASEIEVAGDFSDFGGPNVSYALVDYHVVPGSPLVDNGLFDYEVAEDIDGEPRPRTGGGIDRGPDIGADELVDSDGDGLPDYWETENGLDPKVDDARGDPDHDGISNSEEFRNGTDPFNPETARVTAAPCSDCPPREAGVTPIPTSTVEKAVDAPSDVWVRFGEVAPGDGSEANPFSSLMQGIAPVATGGLVHLASTLDGTATAETPKIAKAMRLRAEGGTARIGDLSVAVPFEEESPTWGRAELALISVEVDPERADPGDSVFLLGTVENIGTGPAESATVDFYVDGTLVDQRPVGLLDLAERKIIRTSYTVDTPGTFGVRAEVHYDGAGQDQWADNDADQARLRVSGEDTPEPGLEFDLALNVDSEPLHAGSNVSLDLLVHNPSFADLDAMGTQFFVDGLQVHEGYVGPLAAGEDTSISFPWDAVSEGSHSISVELNLPDGFPHAEFQSKWVWDCAIPGPTGAYSAPGLHQWSSIGPSLLTNGTGGGPTGSVGRIDAIAPHPTNPNIIYAGAPTGGVWRTVNGGDSWEPIGDALPLISIGALAVDPVTPSILYACTGSANYSGGLGIFKSIDSGNTWIQFVSAAHTPWVNRSIGGANDIVIRYPSPGNVLIYVGSDQGVLRYTSSSPASLYSDPSEWTQILPGRIADLAVHPTDHSFLYASVISDGMYRTAAGQTATRASDWVKLTTDLPAINTIHPKAAGGEARTGQAWQMAIYAANPTTLYAALPNPLGSGENKPRLNVYRSLDSGATWSVFVTSNDSGLYSPFLAAHPTIDGLIYFSGIKLYRYLKSGSVTVGPHRVQGIHDDMHRFVWDPTDATGKRYFIGCDGGIWRGTIDLSGGDLVRHRNNDLRVTMFFDFDASQTDSTMMLGGTQDNGTILYQGNDAWKMVKGGDGYYSIIAPGNQVLYAQHQWLETTVRCNQGGNCSHNNWAKAANGLLNKEGGLSWYMGTAQIACDPTRDYILVAQGLQVLYTSNSGGSWTKIGPTDASLRGHIARVAIQPVRRRIVAGTSKGQIWVRYMIGGFPSWVKVFDPPVGTGEGSVVNMAFSPVDHEILYVILKANQPWARIQMLRIHDEPPGASKYPITGDLPTHHFVPYWPKKISGFKVNTVCGDGRSILRAYVGTDRGVYRGETYAEGGLWTWTRYSDGLPNVSVTDLVVDPTSKQLRAATYGRGAWTTITGP